MIAVAQQKEEEPQGLTHSTTNSIKLDRQGRNRWKCQTGADLREAYTARLP